MRSSNRLPALSLAALFTVISGAVASACGSELDTPILDGADAQADVDAPDSRVGPDADARDASSTDARDASSTDARVDSGPDCSADADADAGLVACGSSCVDTQRDPNHCGTCGRACAAGEGCESGTCRATCDINGVLYPAGAANPADACAQCSPVVSTTAWSPRATVTLLDGGTDVAAQGWSVTTQLPSSVTYGADYVRLQTGTTAGARSGGMLLLYRPGAFEAAKAFKVRVEMLVESVSAHNSLDSAAAIMGSFTPPFGQSVDRSQMIYLDSAAIGWADDTQSAATLTDAYHTYELSVDAAKVATVSVDGVAKLTRNGFVSNGTIAVGDQTNDANVDGVVRIRSVTRICP